MHKFKNRFLMIAFITAVMLFFYFGAGTMIDGGKSKRRKEKHGAGARLRRYGSNLSPFRAWLGGVSLRKKTKKDRILQ